MGHITTAEALRSALYGVGLATLFGAIASWAWTLQRLLRGEGLLPTTPIVERRPVPWGPGTILLLLSVWVFASLNGFELYTRVTRGRRPVPPPAAPARAEAGTKPDHPGGPSDALSPLELMAVQGAINGLLIFLLPTLARLTSGARLRDLGLDLHQWRRQVAVGLVAVLFLMPMIYAVQSACVKLSGMSERERESFKHPVEKMLVAHFSPGVAGLAFLTAVILAPVFEELFFRGFIQSWLVKAFGELSARLRSRSSQQPRPSPLFDPTLDAPAGETAAGLPSPSDDVSSDGNDGSTDRTPATRSAAAIVLTAFLFAGLHAGQWPAPIPLFLLAIGLGVVYQRTGSLIAPIVMHAVFNGFSTLMLFLVALEGPKAEKLRTEPVLERPAPLEKAGATVAPVVPGPRGAKS